MRLLNIQGDKISHTSDYFDSIYDIAIQLITAGNAYTDDTEQAQASNSLLLLSLPNPVQMREERGKGIPSAHRDDSVEENLKHFSEMKAGTSEGVRWCLRAKISVDDQNKALRDPVIYRCNLTPHHRTG